MAAQTASNPRASLHAYMVDTLAMLKHIAAQTASNPRAPLHAYMIDTLAMLKHIAACAADHRAPLHA
jgi:hypothetical protein